MSTTQFRAAVVHPGIIYKYGKDMYFLATKLCMSNPYRQLSPTDDLSEVMDRVRGFFLYKWSKEEMMEKVSEIPFISSMMPVAFDNRRYFCTMQAMELPKEEVSQCEPIAAIAREEVDRFFEKLIEFTCDGIKGEDPYCNTEIYEEVQFWRKIREAMNRNSSYWKDIENCKFYVSLYEENYEGTKNVFNFDDYKANERYQKCKKSIEKG